MATIVKTLSGTWKAVIRKQGWPTASKTFRTKRDAEDWARSTEDEMVRGVYLRRSPSEKTTLEKALGRYLEEVTPTKKASTQKAEKTKAAPLIRHLGKYSLAALSADVIAEYRDKRLKETVRTKYKEDSDVAPRTVSANTVRLELALLSNLFTVAIQEWRIGLPQNPVLNIRKPSPGEGRDRRLSPDEEQKLFQAVNAYHNPMLGWIVRIAVETGMRSSEITSLRRHQVDLKKRVVKLLDTKNGESRTVPLTQAAAKAFKEALENPIRPIDTNLIFFGEPGKDEKRRPYVFSKAWNGMKKRLGMADLRFHDLRHEFSQHCKCFAKHSYYPVGGEPDRIGLMRCA
ncbi:site-specific integrase [Pseudomonas aeruginosa]|uniref:site-specific integrase n=1 Tax=Pseudomonas aeruginosa TaxID=287 RepID=UPI0008FB6C67|nr:site-specific integrase [Pseudomonas aeruginosa]MBG7304501.1 site-specific integrase [Pseudomonas aeruginosa]MDC3947888.1 site-specific integrase [Pseudomonas aeruginosa]OPD81109.1 integrase [Pseudomonas aeruginosa]HBP6438081.1 site-specific integrase [Pseudomonas aeruginosa]HCU2020118.1 site-specific integrase [Pseudomonas aeruginosa]